jgi:hypothetical protein
VHFGLGEATAASISIRWPDGTQQTVDRLAIDSVSTIAEQPTRESERAPW